MAFSRYRSRGIGGLRGGFQQPQQGMQAPMVDPRAQFHQQNQQRHLAGLQQQQMQQLGDPRMIRGTQGIQGFQPPQQGMQVPMRPPSVYAQNPGQQFNPQQAAFGEDPMIAARRGFQPPQPDPLLGQQPMQQMRQRPMGQFNPNAGYDGGQRAPTPEQMQQDKLMEQQMMERARTMKPLRDLPYQSMQPTAVGPPGFAQPPSPPPPSFANAPRPPQQQFSPGPQLGLGGRPDRMIQTPRGQELQSSMIGLSPRRQQYGQPAQFEDQPVETISPPAPQPTQTESGDWGSGSPQELPTAGAAGAGGTGGAPTSWKMSIEPMAYGGMVPGYQNGGGVDPEAIAKMERIVEAIKNGHRQYANQSPFGENPEENEFYRENILPEEKRTFGGTVVPLDSINYAVSDSPRFNIARGQAPMLAKQAELSLLHDWVQDNPDETVYNRQLRPPHGGRFGSKVLQHASPEDGRRMYRNIVPYSRYASELEAG